MAIFRVVHNSNYSVINNTICNDPRLSYKAKGIWMYAFSKPNDWSFHLNDLVNHATDQKSSVKSGLRELEKYGYLVRHQEKGKGRFSKSIWNFFETPKDPKFIEEIKKSLPRADFPSTEKQPLLSTDVLSTEKHVVVVRADAREEKNVLLEQKFTKDDLYAASLRLGKDWSPPEIEEAWDIYRQSSSSVTNPLNYIEGIINKNRIKKCASHAKNIIKEKSKWKKKLNTPQKNLQTKTSENLNQQKEPKKESEITNEQFLEKDTWAQTWQTYCQEIAKKPMPKHLL